MIVLGKDTFVSSTGPSQSQSTPVSTTSVSITQDNEGHEALIIILSVIASIALIMAIVFLLLYLRYVIIMYILSSFHSAS